MWLWYATAQPEDSLRLCLGAAIRYSASLEANPDALTVIRSYAKALNAAADELDDSSEAQRLYREAIVQYRRVLLANPQDDEIVLALGEALADLGCSEDADTDAAIFAEARAFLEKAVALAPGSAPARMALGLELMDEADEFADQRAVPLYHAAIEHLAAASRLVPDDHEPLFKWGRALTQLAELAEGPEHERLCRKAIEQYERAVEIEPTDTRSLHNWASALHDIGLGKEGNERESVLASARERYVAALKSDPGNTLTPWNLALLEAARGRSEACQFWLEWAIPLISDPAECLETQAFDQVRAAPWFQQMVSQSANS